MTQQRVDSRRLAYLREVISDLASDRKSVTTLASLVLSTFIGLELLQRQITPTETKRVLAALQALIFSHQDLQR
jgi:hypothetical protein